MKSIKRYYSLHASPADVYNALTNQVMLEIWTGEKAEFTPEPDTDFSLWDGSITGRNLAFEQDRLIRQIWYFGEEESQVTFKLHPDKDGTSVELRHENIPDDAYENISDGWDEDYFDSLKALFNN